MKKKMFSVLFGFWSVRVCMYVCVWISLCGFECVNWESFAFSDGSFFFVSYLDYSLVATSCFVTIALSLGASHTNFDDKIVSCIAITRYQKWHKSQQTLHIDFEMFYSLFPGPFVFRLPDEQEKTHKKNLKKKQTNLFFFYTELNLFDC